MDNPLKLKMIIVNLRTICFPKAETLDQLLLNCHKAQVPWVLYYNGLISVGLL